jgi:hypothetical protein
MANIHSSRLGHGYWDYATCWAAVIYMKTSKGDDGINAWKRYTGRNANLSEMRMFGEICFVQVPSETRKKNNLKQLKGKMGRVLGQQAGSSGWLVRMEDTGNVLLSIDISFAHKRPTLPQQPPTTPLVFPSPYQVAAQAKPEPVILPVTPATPPPIMQDNKEQETPPEEPLPVVRAPAPSWEMRPADEPAPKAFRPLILARRTKSRRQESPEINLVEWYGDNAQHVYAGAEAATNAIMESAGDTPVSVEEALNSEDWRNAMKRELDLLETKGTLVEASKPAGQTLLDCRWVYALKRDANGKIIKYEARLVA